MAKRDADTPEALESEEFLAALMNGNDPGTKRLVTLIDLRFRTAARRDRGRHADLVAGFEAVTGRLDELSPLVTVIRWTRLVIPIVLAAGTTVGAVGKAAGWW